MSAKVSSANSFKFRYGRVEIRAKLPKGDWIWPAMWMMPADAEYGGWPASGEIDIVESRGNANYPRNIGGCEAFGSTLHWGPDFFGNKFGKTHADYSLPSGTFNDDFHTFGLYWDDKVLYTYVDNPNNKVLNVDHSTIDYWTRGEYATKQSYYSNPWAGSPNKCAPLIKSII